MNIGIIKETKSPADRRVPLTPVQCRQIMGEYPGIRVYIQSSDDRCFTDHEYKAQGIPVTTDLGQCDILLGIKEVKPDQLIAGKTYFFFSHTIKKQSQNRELLRSALSRQIRLVDYEMLTDSKGVRIIGFGRWAGLAGTYLGIRGFCIREGIRNLVAIQECKGLGDLMEQARTVRLPSVKIALTGDGRVAGGSEEMLGAFGIQKVTVDQFLKQGRPDRPVYVQLDPSKYNLLKSGAEFDLADFFEHPDAYESNFGRFCSETDLLIMAAYWDPRAPVLFTPGIMRDPDFGIRVIADITCDIHGSVPSSIRATTFENPYYDYDPFTEKEEEAFSNPQNVTVMTIDNLPCGLPKEASEDFGHNLMKYIIPLLLGDDHDEIIKRATITESGKLTRRFEYLDEWVK